MPGIAGIVRKSGGDLEGNRSLLEKMCRRLRHSDDYTVETAVHERVALAFVGLAHADGRQHLRDDSATGMCSAYSGYIYGFKGGAFVESNIPGQLIHGWKRRGAELPRQIDGSFNLALFDTRNGDGLVSTDRMGHRHLYYADLGDLFLFATEIKAFLASDAFTYELDEQSVEDVFNIGYPLGDRTIFKQARFLRGGHRLRFERGQVGLEKWDDFKFDEASDTPLEQLIHEADNAYRGVLTRRVDGYENVILPLSGGLDSRFIAAHARREGIEPVGVTHGIRGCHDYLIARKLASRLGYKEHRFTEIRPTWLYDNLGTFAGYGEGMVDVSPAMLLGIIDSYGLPPKTTCFLNGIFGGPTNFGSGYFRSDDIDADLTFEQRITNISRSVRAHYDMPSFYSLFRPEWRDRLPAAFTNNLTEEFRRHESLSPRFHHQKDTFFIRNRLTRYMNKVDCNRFRLHDHFALCDDRLLDFYLRLPAELKVNRRFMIEYLKAKFPEVARIEYQATGADLYSPPKGDPLGLRQHYRKAMYYLERLTGGRFKFYDRRNYAHHSQWYRADRRLRELYEIVLTDKRTVERGYYEPAAVKRLLERQRKGGNSYYELTWLFSFEFFCRMFVDADARHRQ